MRNSGERPEQNELPYERFMRSGPGSLTNAELLAVILRTGTSSASATELGRRVLAFRDPANTALSVLHDMDLRALMSIRGIGEVKAVKLLCLAELSRRMGRERAERELCFTSPGTVADYYMEDLRHEPREITVLLMLDGRLTLLREERLTVGTVDSAPLSVRDVFISSLKSGAVRILLLHNHPSGDPTPSGEDIAVTRRICSAGKLLCVPLLDHIVIGDGCYTSMKELGYLED